jgi:putative glutamine amidotransferase
LDERWWPFLRRCGLVPLPLPNHLSEAAEVVGTVPIAGLVLSGGDDLIAYGGRTPERDETEHALIDWAVSRWLPVIGVCRGMQILLQHYGAPLVPVAGHVAVRHLLEVVNGPSRIVNSFHRLGAHVVPDDFVVEAVAGAVVERARHRTAPMTGIMWHPEREAVAAPEDVRLFRETFRVGTEP